MGESYPALTGAVFIHGVVTSRRYSLSHAGNSLLISQRPLDEARADPYGAFPATLTLQTYTALEASEGAQLVDSLLTPQTGNFTGNHTSDGPTAPITEPRKSLRGLKKWNFGLTGFEPATS
jgi:hypothetical protein